MAESKAKEAEFLPEDVGTDDCLTSYTYIYSPDLLKYAFIFLHCFLSVLSEVFIYNKANICYLS